MSKKVLLVDDDRLVRKGLVDVFKQSGLEVVEAENGKEGYETAAKDRPDLVVTDVHMPEMDGLEMIQKLRADEKTKDVPVIVLSVDEATSSINAALAAGVTFYLSKTMTPDAIAEQVVTAAG